jgi:serine/threonine protein kinase
MAKLYGGRWEWVKNLTQGGQGVVYLVKDTTGEHADLCVLKTIINPKRHDRFVKEVTACKTLVHPNIMRLLDHSALDADPSDKEKMFMVMPLMAEGSLEKRAAVYKNSLDSTLQVAISLAGALAHAHKNGIVHRDVKPANILFNTPGHDAVLSDFGICLIRETERSTDTGEIVGPRGFMPPEVEKGDLIDVTPAIDVYLLAKVIYFMLSGGKSLFREEHREPPNDLSAGRDARHEQLWKLFDHTICTVDKRIKSMDEVCAELQRIATWQPAVAMGVSASASANIARMQAMKKSAATLADSNRAVAAVEKAQLEQYQDRVSNWLMHRVNKLIADLKAAGLDVSPTSEAKLAEVHGRKKQPMSRARPRRSEPHFGTLIAERGLVVLGEKLVMMPDHVLCFRVYAEPPYQCFDHDMTSHAARDLSIKFHPYYWAKDDWRGFFNTQGSNPYGARSVTHPPGGLTVDFNHTTIMHRSTMSAWVGDMAEYEALISPTVDIFVDRIVIWNDRANTSRKFA